MYSIQMTAEMAASRRHDLIAAAEARRLVRQTRGPERAATPARPVRRTWLRLTTRPAHS